MVHRVLRLFLILALVFTHPVVTAGARVGVLLSDSDTTYWEVLEGLQAHLNTGPGELAVVTLASSDPAQETLADLADVDVVVAVGTRASRVSRQLPERIPVLSVFLPRAAYRSVSAATSGRPRSAIYLEQPLSRQFAFVRALLPEARVVGTLLGPSSASPEADLRQAAAASGFRLEVARVEDAAEPVAAMKALVRRTDAILAIPDAAVLTPNRAKWLLYMAYRRNTPVVGFSRPYVDAGALASIYSTPRQVGRQAAERLADVGRGPALGPPAFPRYFSIALNPFTARSLGIRLPEKAALRQVVSDGGEAGR